MGRVVDSPLFFAEWLGFGFGRKLHFAVGDIYAVLDFFAAVLLANLLGLLLDKRRKTFQ